MKFIVALLSTFILGTTVWALDPTGFRDVKVQNNVTVGKQLLLADGTNNLNFTITALSSITVHNGDVYTDTSPYGSGSFTITTGVTNGVTFQVTGTNEPQNTIEAWTKSSGNAGSTSPLEIVNYVQNSIPSQGFTNETNTGWTRLGTNNVALLVAGQPIIQANLSAFNSVSGPSVTVGDASFQPDPDSVFNIASFYPDILKVTLANSAWPTNPALNGTGSEYLACDGPNELTCTSFFNYYSNTEYVPYLNNVGGFSTGNYVDGTLFINDNNQYTLTLSAAATVAQGTVYTDSNADTFTVVTTATSTTALTVIGPLFPTQSFPPAASGTLTYVSGPTTGNLTYTSVAPLGYMAWTMGGRYSNNELMRLTYQQMTINAPTKVGPGSLTNPGLGFTDQIGSGLMHQTNNLTIVNNDQAAIDTKAISGNQMTFCLNCTASSSAGNVLQAQTTINGQASYILQNLSQSSSASSGLIMREGSGSPSDLSLINHAYDSTTYTGGYGVLNADSLQSGLILASAYSSGVVKINAGGLTSATERLRITTSAVQVQNSAHFDSNSLTINNVADPASAQDAATKNYADTHFQIGPLTGDVTTSVRTSGASTVAAIQGTTVSGTTGTGNVVFSASPTFTTKALFPDGASISAPGIAFSSDTQTGIFRTGSFNPTIVADGHPLIDALMKQNSPLQVNIGIGQSAYATDGSIPLQTLTSYNGEADSIFQNSSTAVSGVATAIKVRGGNSTTGDVKLINAEFGSQTYYGGYGVLSVDNEGSGLILASELSSGVIKFAAGSLGSASERMQITTSKVQMETLLQLVVQGSGVTPTCAAEGLVSVTHGHILCICTAASGSWVKASDGSTSCTF